MVAVVVVVRDDAPELLSCGPALVSVNGFPVIQGLVLLVCYDEYLAILVATPSSARATLASIPSSARATLASIPSSAYAILVATPISAPASRILAASVVSRCLARREEILLRPEV